MNMLANVHQHYTNLSRIIFPNEANVHKTDEYVCEMKATWDAELISCFLLVFFFQFSVLFFCFASLSFVCACDRIYSSVKLALRHRVWGWGRRKWRINEWLMTSARCTSERFVIECVITISYAMFHSATLGRAVFIYMVNIVFVILIFIRFAVRF